MVNFEKSQIKNDQSSLKSKTMCLSIPAKVLSVEGKKPAFRCGAEYNAALDLVENVKVGDYVLLHSGFVIQIIDEKKPGKP